MTPFAARAVRQGLHATLVVLVRKLVSGMDSDPNLTPSGRSAIESSVLPLILDRVTRSDPSEREAIHLHLQSILDRWKQRSEQWAGKDQKAEYWEDSSPRFSLLMSAERYVCEVASGLPVSDTWPTPNSMRDVEPGSPFRLVSWHQNR